MELSRSECPKWFADKIDLWTQYWINKVNNPNTRNNWDWYDIEGMPTNQCLLPLLCFDTKNHCSYCDKNPLRAKEIDHFKPKVECPEEAFSWENLFIVCKDCNYYKLSNNNDLILKPDEIQYKFDTYFFYEEYSGDLKPKGTKDSIEYRRADETIKSLKLNENGLPRARKRYSDCKHVFENQDIDTLEYRFIYLF